MFFTHPDLLLVYPVGVHTGYLDHENVVRAVPRTMWKDFTASLGARPDSHAGSSYSSIVLPGVSITLFFVGRVTMGVRITKEFAMVGGGRPGDSPGSGGILASVALDNCGTRLFEG